MSKTPKRARGRPKSPFTEKQPATMQSLDRALSLLNGLAHNETATLTDLSLTMGIPTATTHRILSTLQKHGYAEFDEARQVWMIGIEAYRTGSSFLKRTKLLDISSPVMRRLMESTGETANLAIADGSEVVFIGQVETTNPIRAFFTPGTRTAMHASGTGKAILATMKEQQLISHLQSAGLKAFTDNTLVVPTILFADLAQTRKRGWSFDRDERHMGMSCIGAAIFDPRGEAIAGISISGPSSRFPNSDLGDFGRSVGAAAAEITRAIGGVIRRPTE